MAHILYPHGEEPTVNSLINKEPSSVQIRGAFGYYTEKDIPALNQEIARHEQELNDIKQFLNTPRHEKSSFDRKQEEIEKEIKFLENAIEEIKRNGRSTLH